MKFLLMAVLCLAVVACDNGPGSGPKATLKSQIDSVSYVLGMNIGKQVKADTMVGINKEIFQSGLRDGIEGKTAVISDSQAQNVMAAFQMEMQKKQMAMMLERQKSDSVKGAANKAAGEKFLAENKTKPNIKTTPSGLQYEVITEGTGPMPSANSQVQVNYKGTLIDGTVFDESKGGPVTLSVDGVIPGWTEALKMMKTGSKWKLYIPSNLAYGPNGSGEKIGPDAALIFDIELVGIQPGGNPAGNPPGGVPQGGAPQGGAPPAGH